MKTKSKPQCEIITANICVRLREEMFYKRNKREASNQPEVFAEEASDITLSCNFSDSGTTDNLHWYRQYGRSKPEFLVLTYSSAKEAQRSDVDPRFTVKVEKREHVDLKIFSAAVSDSALYYCALQPTQHVMDVLAVASLSTCSAAAVA
uniref:T-cell receptor alpha/delta variable 36.2.12 n=1 Tax=Sinocyclocheilus grahami TaxID=75366 RepID=A0A672Q007_SINGR